jgi:murein DD-endopeptidase MepM/ murein hydrolase activator NlpD
VERKIRAIIIRNLSGIMNIIQMKHFLFGIIAIPLVIFLLLNIKTKESKSVVLADEEAERGISTIAGIVQPRETLESIFNKYNLSKTELSDIFDSAKDLYNLSKISVDSAYSFKIDKQNRIQSMQYGISESSFLKVVRMQESFTAETVTVEYKKRIGSLYINVVDNLVLSMPSSHKEYLRIALELSDIYAWDIDFFTDIKNGDTVKIMIEELWVGEIFKGYGNILAAEFSNSGKVYRAYRFERDGYVDYFGNDGKSLRRILLRSPLKFRYISSYFSRKRFHPILRIYRPHPGIDYAAPMGTPVSAAGDGKVVFAGYKGQIGNIVKIKHKGGLETHYGHLSKIPKKTRKGAKVSQGDIIGYVGSTGLSTGPHLDYRIKLNGRFVNPLKVKLSSGKSIPGPLMAEFKKIVGYMNKRLTSLTQPVVAFSVKEKESS